MIRLVRWVLGFCLGLLVGRGFTKEDLFTTVISGIAAVAYVALCYMVWGV